MSSWLSSLKWDAGGLVAVIAQVQPHQILKAADHTAATDTDWQLCSVAH